MYERLRRSRTLWNGHNSYYVLVFCMEAKMIQSLRRSTIPLFVSAGLAISACGDDTMSIPETPVERMYRLPLMDRFPDGTGLERLPPASGVDEIVVEGSVATLNRFLTSPEVPGVHIHMTTKNLDPGFAYAVWLVAFSKIENCQNYDDPTRVSCGSADIKRQDSGEVDVGLTFKAFVGGVPDASGTLDVSAFLQIGDATNILNGVPFHDKDAEFHLLLKDHGPASEDKNKLYNQLTTFKGCVDKAGVSGQCPTRQIVQFAPSTRWDQLTCTGHSCG